MEVEEEVVDEEEEEVMVAEIKGEVKKDIWVLMKVEEEKEEVVGDKKVVKVAYRKQDTNSDYDDRLDTTATQGSVKQGRSRQSYLACFPLVPHE